VCGEASNGIEAIEAALRLKPDLIVLDYSMPEMNGVEAASVLTHRMPGVRIIIFTLHADAVGEAVKKSIKVDLVLAKLDGMDNLIVQIKTLLGLPNNSRAPSA
jgi:DNA-binding NarL/FixJ family response regulator